ncbi:MAG TPA: hypothetical protein VMA77_30035 [Solirubrobacteraceae bacterium]|nr:hypothetical protein [Solirubrobacteraceae bacterium]
MSGKIAAILPLPDAASGFNAFIAEKSLVNDVAEMLIGVDDELEVVAEVVALAVVLVVLLDELPHPATTADNARPIAHTRNKRALITARSSHRRAK